MRAHLTVVAWEKYIAHAATPCGEYLARSDDKHTIAAAGAHGRRDTHPSVRQGMPCGAQRRRSGAWVYVYIYIYIYVCVCI